MRFAGNVSTQRRCSKCVVTHAAGILLRLAVLRTAGRFNMHFCRRLAHAHLEDAVLKLAHLVLQVVAARKVLRGTVESLIRETRGREAAGKADGAGSHANGAGAHSNGGSNGAATVATQDAAKVRGLQEDESQEGGGCVLLADQFPPAYPMDGVCCMSTL